MIQLAKIVGFKVIATASPHSFDVVKAHGADHVVDYHDPKAALEEVKKVTNDGVVAGLECIGDAAGVQLAVDSFGPKGGPLTQIIPPPKEVKARPEVPLDHRILLYTAQGYVSPMSDPQLNHTRNSNSLLDNPKYQLNLRI